MGQDIPWTVGNVKRGTQIWEQKPSVIMELMTRPRSPYDSLSWVLTKLYRIGEAICTVQRHFCSQQHE
jgi:hypothetical protein